MVLGHGKEGICDNYWKIYCHISKHWSYPRPAMSVGMQQITTQLARLGKMMEQEESRHLVQRYRQARKST